MDTTTPLISVIMPVHNAADYLPASVGSVLAQTFKDFELICFNDASTDGSLCVLRGFAEADRRVRIIDSAINVRQGGGRNRALRAAKGRYIFFLDADDSIEPETLACCAAAASAFRSEAVFFDYYNVAPTRKSKERIRQLGPDAHTLSGDALRRRIALRTTPVWSAMYSRDLITGNNLFFPEGVFYEDNAVALAIQLAAENPVKLDRTLYNYRTDNISVSRSRNNYKFFDRIDSAVTLLEHTRRLGLYGRFADEIDFVFINQYLVHTIYGAIYRFDSVQADRIREVSANVSRYIGNFRSNRYYRAQSISQKLKPELHMRMPRFIKLLSNLNRRLKK